MKLAHLTATPDGGSRFLDFELSVDFAAANPTGKIIKRSDMLPIIGSLIMEMPAELVMDWCQPVGQFHCRLVGHGRIRDDRRRDAPWGAGEMFFTDDSGGRGHRTRTVNGPVRLLFLYPRDDFKLGG